MPYLVVQQTICRGAARGGGGPNPGWSDQGRSSVGSKA